MCSSHLGSRLISVSISGIVSFVRRRKRGRYRALSRPSKPDCRGEVARPNRRVGEGRIMGEDAGKAAETLMCEHSERVTYKPFAAAHDITTAEDAYAVQREYVRLLMQSRGIKAAGYKIGLTTPRMQAMCGIESPVAGVILQDRVHASRARIDASAYGRVGLEFEIAVRLGKDLVPTGSTPNIADVTAAVDGVCPAVEIIDDRGADYRLLDALSLIA